MTTLNINIYLHDVICENSEEDNEKLRIFLENGGDPNTTVKVGIKKKNSPLILHALRRGNYAAVKMLCEFGANVNLKHDEEYPVLVRALLCKKRICGIYQSMVASIIIIMPSLKPGGNEGMCPSPPPLPAEQNLFAYFQLK